MKKATKIGREPSYNSRNRTLKKAVYGEWFKKPREPVYHEEGEFSGGYGGKSFNGGENSARGGQVNSQQKGKGKRMERSKWLRMYWARKNAKK